MLENKIDEIDEKLDKTEDYEVIINLLYQKVDLLEEIIQQLQEENKQKDKMTDEMAKFIATLDIDEDICSKIENEHCDKMNFGECEDCIKEYFKKKAEKEELK